MARESVIDWSRYNLATEAFKKCDEDGNEGLSWDEVEACEVRFLVQFFMKISVVSILICQLVFQLIEIFESWHWYEVVTSQAAKELAENSSVASVRQDLKNLLYFYIYFMIF